MRPASKTAARALRESPLAGLLEQALLLGRVASLVAEICPEAADPAHSQTPIRCSFEGRTIIVVVRNPSQAAKLRQRTAEVERRLRQCFPEVTGIRIRHQPGAGPEPGRDAAPHEPGRHPPPDRETLSAALGFAETLSAGLRDSPLRRSAQRLQAALRTQLKRSDRGDGPDDPDRD